LIKSPDHILVGTPCYGGQVTSHYFSSILKLQEACQREGVALTIVMPDGGDLVQRARQEILASFLEVPEATHLLFIDSDIGFEPEQVFRLLRFNTDMAAATYPYKNISWEKVRAAALEGREKLEPASLYYVVEAILPPLIREGFIRALSVGTGFILVKRQAFTRLMERYPELRYSRGKGKPDGWAFFNCLIDEKTGVYLSEDYSFCRLWTRMGGEIWVDLNSRLNHVGPTVFTGDFAALLPPNPQAGGGA
jgi:hypothetical protein